MNPQPICLPPPPRPARGWRLLPLLAAALAAVHAGHAQTILFSDAFETDSSAQWSVFDGSDNDVPDYTVDWAFDYGSVRYVSGGVTNTIPPAPGSAGTTRGLKLTVNKDALESSGGASYTAGVSVFPKDKAFSGDYRLKADMWLNYNGPAFGGTGSTEFANLGIDHRGDQVVWANGRFNGDGVWFAVTGEGGASRDYRAYVGDGATPNVELLGADGGFLDRDGNGSPEVEVNPTAGDARNPLNFVLPAPPGETRGAPGKQWVQVEVRQRIVDGSPLVTWLLNGHVIAEHSQAAVFGQSAGTIMLGTMDIFASIALPREDNFVLFDNVRVESLQGVPAPPVVELTAEDPDAAEPSDPGTVIVSRQGDTAAPLTVRLRVSGTATPDADYVALPAEVVIPAGQASTPITITPKDDENGEPDETIIVAFAASEAYEVRANNFAIVTLKDDGDVPAASLAVVKPIAYELPGTRAGRLALRLTTPALGDLTVAYTVAGTAVAGADFEALPGSVSIPAGETEALLPIVPKDNSLIDGDRTVVVTLTPGTGYKLGTAVSGTVTIRNDDLPAGQVLFTETFDTDATPRWVVNIGPSDGVADFFFDYAAVGVPPAPRAAGTTRGLKLQANLTSAIFGGLSVSPSGQAFPGNFRLRFDLWQNYNGPLNGGGSGSTQITGAGVGTAGTAAHWPGGTTDGVWFASTGDGGSSVDYRAYSPAAASGYGDASGVFAAGTAGNPRNEANPYYAEFGSQAAPDDQVAGFPGQTGATFTGAQGFQWHDVVIEKSGNQVHWFIDGLRIATVPIEGFTLGGDNILLMHSDINGGSSADPNAPDMAFGLVDNVRVEAIESPASPPHITGVQLSGGDVVIEFQGADADAANAFKLAAAPAVTGTYTVDPAAVIEAVSPGRFRARIAATGGMRFFRIGR